MKAQSAVLILLRSMLLDADQYEKLEVLLMSESNLPGPRGNLELAGVFADQFQTNDVAEEMWELLLKWTEIDSSQVDTNEARVFLPFCAIQALGAYFPSANETKRRRCLDKIVAAMSDSRWRIREASAMALQRIGESNFPAIRILFEQMFDHANLLERRAFVAALAHPPILKDTDAALFALELSEHILDDIAADPSLGKSEEYRVLSKGLEYAISLFVEKLPLEGFALFNKYAVRGDKRIQKIVKSNIGKSRIAKKYPDEIRRTEQLYGLQ
ncbi:hypothetical protein D3C76_27140 [compost metagenome]